MWTEKGAEQPIWPTPLTALPHPLCDNGEKNNMENRKEKTKENEGKMEVNREVRVAYTM